MKNISLLRLREIKHLKIILENFFLYTVRTYIDKVFGQLSYDTSSKTKISIFFKCIVISVFDVFDRNLFNKDLV